MEKVAEFIKRHADGTAAVAIFLVTLLFFLPGLTFEAIPLDNTSYVGKDYLLVFSWQNILHHLTNPILGLHSPLVMYSLMADYFIWGKDLLQFGGRIHNILLHSASATLFYLLLRQLKLTRLDPEKPFTLSIPAAVFGAVCFALHSQRVESVIWLVERKDVQAIFLGLLSTWFFIRSYRKNRLPIAGALIYFLSFGAKPTVITLPGVLLLGIWVCTENFDWKKALKMLSLYLAAVLIYIGINAVQLGNFAEKSATGAVSIDRIEIVILNYTNYFFRTLMPISVQPLYAPFRWTAPMTAMTVIFCLAAAICLVTGVVKCKKRNIFSCVAAPLLLAFMGAVLPMAGFQVIGNAEFADRYSYYPSLFIWIGMALAMECISFRSFIGKFALWAYAALIAVLGICYLHTWQNKESFINAALGDGINANPAALRMAAWLAFEKKEFDTALAFANQAALNSGSTDAGKLFILALEGLVEINCGDPAGLDKIDRAITSPAWGVFRKTSRGFSENVLLIAAQMHLSKNTPADERFAAGIFTVLGHLFEGGDPAKELNYRAISALLLKDYQQAEALTLQALKYAPQDANMLANLQHIREAAKNHSAKAASTE